MTKDKFTVLPGGRDKKQDGSGKLSSADRHAKVNNLKIYLRGLENDMAVVNQQAKRLGMRSLEKQCGETHQAVLRALKIIKREEKKLILHAGQVANHSKSTPKHIKLIHDSDRDLETD